MVDFRFTIAVERHEEKGPPFPATPSRAERLSRAVVKRDY
jgi:hypothetical protein